MSRNDIPERGTHVISTQMAEGYVPPSGSLNPAATVEKSVVDDYEAQVEDLTHRLNVAAADLLETRSQRAHLARQLDEMEHSAIQHAERHQRIFEEMLRERARPVDERDELAKTLESEREHHKAVREYAVARQTERDEARDEVVRLGRSLEQAHELVAALRAATDRDATELVRLRTIIGELGAAEAAEPPPEVDVTGTLRPTVAEQVWPPEAAFWTDDADGDPGGPFRSRP